MRNRIAGFAIVTFALTACRDEPAPAGASQAVNSHSDIERKLAQYTSVKLTSDLGRLSENERRMIPLLIDAARWMDSIYWHEAYGSRDSLLQSIRDPNVRRYAEINYGPWDRLDNNAPFVEGIGPKPKGAAFYPPDVSKEELEAASKSGVGKALRSQY